MKSNKFARRVLFNFIRKNNKIKLATFRLIASCETWTFNNLSEKLPVFTNRRLLSLKAASEYELN